MVGLVAILPIPFTCPIYALCVVFEELRGGTALLSRTKDDGKGSRAARIIIFMIIRDETTGNAESTYHVEGHKTQPPNPGFSHCRRRDLGQTYSSTNSDEIANWDLGAGDIVSTEKQMQ